MFEKYYQGEKPFFRTYAYAAPGYEQGDYIYGQPRKLGLATKENYEIYKAVGFNTVFSGTVGTYYGEDWETSVCKKVMDEVYAAGIDKYIVGDQAFYELSCQADGIVGEGKCFATEQDLDAFVGLFQAPCLLWGLLKRRATSLLVQVLRSVVSFD